MQAMEPTYFLYSGKLFHAVAWMGTHRGESGESDDVPPRRGHDGPAVPKPHRGEDPRPDGPESEPIGGEDDEAPSDEVAGRVAEKPAIREGFGAPLTPTHDSPDGNPIDPRVF